MREEVILVNEKDEATGVMEKMEAHEKALLHRAFSVFIFNGKGQMLLQRRALSKYHSAGLWTNTCCSHPRPGESTDSAASRRLMEEMGMDTQLHYKTSFIYKAPFDNNLTEHEFDHLFTGVSDKEPVINPEEVDSYKWMSPEEVKTQVAATPELFTVWFKIALEKVF
ncbi:MAG: isopentenyl-diphosphate Delta-isomerase [Bacteroidia bacterium]|nr:isopentenyl-diphosphate Delta-isomerase [Bacteroidia bacterium]